MSSERLIQRLGAYRDGGSIELKYNLDRIKGFEKVYTLSRAFGEDKKQFFNKIYKSDIDGIKEENELIDSEEKKKFEKDLDELIGWMAHDLNDLNTLRLALNGIENRNMNVNIEGYELRF